MQYSLQHWTLLSPPHTSTTECHFCFGPATSFFLELWVINCPLLFPTSILDTFQPREGWWGGRSSSGVISFFLFILFMGFLQQDYWSGLPFLPPVDHLLSEFFSMTRPSLVALYGMAHGFIELHKPYICVVTHTPLTRLWSMKGNSKFTQVLIFIYLLWTQLMCYSFKMPLCEICYLFSCVIDYFVTLCHW